MESINTVKACRAASARVFLLAIVVGGTVLVSGCATTGKGSEAVESFKGSFKGLGQEIGKLTKRKPGGRSGFIAANYAADDVPHTLLKKPVQTGRLTSGFGYRLNPKGVRLPKKHKGVDYFAPEGTPIYAAGDGEIVRLYISSSYGNYIKIKHANGFATAYAHMHEFAPGLAEGSVVTKGQPIGTIGTTGRSTGPHLHYEMLYNGRFIDPLFE